MIKSAKGAIAAVLCDGEGNDEELETIHIRVERLLNLKPLTTVSDDPNDNLVLIPSHFLIGQMGGDFVPESVDSTPCPSGGCAGQGQGPRISLLEIKNNWHEV